jgi:hypothetical protein
MTNPEIYAITYWCHKGKHEEIAEALNKLVPAQGEVKDHENNPALERFRVASNCYADLYNNGLCNRAAAFQDIFGFEGPYHEYEPDEDDDDSRTSVEIDKDWWTVANVNRVEAGMDRIVILAAIEQGIEVPENTVASVLGPVVEETSVVEKRSAVEKPFVQSTGEDGNVFSIIGRVSGALKGAGQAEQAKEFKDKAFASESYDEVLRLAMEYCEVA